MLFERLVEHAPDPPLNPADPVDDSLHAEIEVREALLDLLQEAVDVVLFTSFYHMEILHLKMFDVKSLD